MLLKSDQTMNLLFIPVKAEHMNIYDVLCYGICSGIVKNWPQF